MIDILKTHFTAIWITLAIVLGVVLTIIAVLFAMFRADAVREKKDDPTKIAASLTLSTLKGVLRLRRAVEQDSEAPRRARSSAELDMTITPGSLAASDIPKPPESKP